MRSVNSLLLDGGQLFWGAANAYDVRLDRTGTGELSFKSTGTAGSTRIIVVGNASQALNLQEWRDSNNNPLAFVTKDGSATIGGSAATATELQVRGAAASNRSLTWATAGALRWILRANSTAESGSNVGSDLELVARDDTGANLATPMVVRRADGRITFLDTVHRTETVGGLTGTSVTRHVGAVSGAAPTSGTFAVGDWVNDLTDGTIWTCTVSGTPGLWAHSSSVGGGSAAAPSFASSYKLAVGD